MASLEANKECVASAIEAHANEMSWPPVDPYAIEDIVVHTPDGRTTQGIRAFQELQETIHAGFPDYHTIIDDLVAEGDKVIALVRWMATNSGELMGIPPTGKRIEMDEVLVFRLTPEGKIAELWAYQDMMSMMQQLGLAPPGPPPKALMFVMRLAGRFKRGSDDS